MKREAARPSATCRRPLALLLVVASLAMISGKARAGPAEEAEEPADGGAAGAEEPAEDPVDEGVAAGPADRAEEPADDAEASVERPAEGPADGAEAAGPVDGVEEPADDAAEPADDAEEPADGAEAGADQPAEARPDQPAAEPADGAEGPGSPRPSPFDAPAHPRGWVAAWATLGVGLTVAGLGGSLLALAYEVHEEAWAAADQRQLDRTFPLYVAGWTAFALGAAGLVSSVVLFVLYGKSAAYDASGATATVTPLAGRDLAGIALAASF